MAVAVEPPQAASEAEVVTAVPVDAPGHLLTARTRGGDGAYRRTMASAGPPRRVPLWMWIVVAVAALSFVVTLVAWLAVFVVPLL